VRPDPPVVDLHADLLWRTAEGGKDPWRVCDGEMLDLPRMREHGPSLQFFTLYTPGRHTGMEATAYADRLLALWEGLVEQGDGRLGWARGADDLGALDPAGLTGLLSMEGASPLRGEIAELERYHARGLRSLGLTHNPRNEAGDGCGVPAKERRGLTAFGRDLVPACAELGILLDVAHLAQEGFADLMDALASVPGAPPVVSTHTGCQALTPQVRNLTDEQLGALAATGGLAGITLYPAHIRIEGLPDTLDNAVEHALHVAEVCGIDHVAVGADLDGFEPPGLPDGADTPLCYGMFAERLAGRGLSPGDVAKVMGGNALRVLGSVLR